MGMGDPPVAGTLNSVPAFPLGLKMIVPFALQLPPPRAFDSQSVWEGPPEASTLLSLPSAKYPIERLSGDQKG